MKLEDELSESKVAMDADEFKTIIKHAYWEFYRETPTERLLFRPTEALGYCAQVRQRCMCLAIPEELILRTLINLRKDGQMKRDEMS